MILIDGVKYSCLECIRGHRSTLCQHDKRPLLLVKKKGRPNLLYPDGNKNYRIAVFAKEVAEDTEVDLKEKCRDRPVVILKASDKYIYDIKSGEIVGPYCEESAQNQTPMFRPENFVNMSFCCLGSLARKECSCNQKKVLKKRILQSYLKKNQGKVDMEGLLRTHSAGLKVEKPKTVKLGGCCGGKVKKEEEPVVLSKPEPATHTFEVLRPHDYELPKMNPPVVKSEQLMDLSIPPVQPQPNTDFNMTQNAYVNSNPPPMYANGALDNSGSFAGYLHSLGPQMPVSDPQVQVPFSSQMLLPETSTSLHGLNLPVGPQYPISFTSAPLAYEQNGHPTYSRVIMNNNGAAAQEQPLGHATDHDVPFDYDASLFLQNNNDVYRAPSNNELLYGNNNQLFKVINVPSCSLPGTCLCSSDCSCPSCETHNPSSKKEDFSASNTLHANPVPEFDQRNVYSNMVPADLASKAPDYFGFLKQIIGIEEENSGEESSRSESVCNDLQSEIEPADAEQCSCAEGACFCSNCERHGIIEGIRLDDFFGSVGRDPSGATKHHLRPCM